jgi:phage gpG-like protein
MLSFSEWAAQLERSAVRAKNEIEIPTEVVMKAVAERAKAAIGTYEFGWPQLKPETIAQKATGDSPLLETGELRESITSSAERTPYGAEGVVGSSEKKALWHELGTSKVRPFLSEALVRSAPLIEETFGKFAAELLSSQ